VSGLRFTGSLLHFVLTDLRNFPPKSLKFGFTESVKEGVIDKNLLNHDLEKAARKPNRSGSMVKL
jgi:hypothetical protein